MFLLTAALLSGTTALAVAPPTIEQAEKALQIAQMAAENGLTDLSQRAVVESLQWGPPTISSAVDTYDIRIEGARVDTSRPVPRTAVQKFNDELPTKLLTLVRQWQQGGVTPKKLFATLQTVVLPPQRPNRAFFYRIVDSNADRHPYQIPQSTSLADMMLQQATTAGQLSKLVEQLESRTERALPELMLLAVVAAAEDGDQDRLSESVQAFEVSLRGRQQPELITETVFAGLRLFHSGRHLRVAARLLEIAADTVSQTNDVSPTQLPPQAVILAGIRAQFAVSRNAEAIRLLSSFLQFGGSPSDAQTVEEWNPLDVAVAARELYRRGLQAEARQLLGEQVIQFEEAYAPGMLDIDSDHPQRYLPDNLVTQTQAVPGRNVDPDAHAAAVWLCTLNLETNTSGIMFAFPDFQNVSSPIVSPDGNAVAFAATEPGEVLTSDSKLYVCQLPDGPLHCVGNGTMPSWSPAGNRLVCSRYSPDRGVWIVRASGADWQRIDPDGWSAQWSPDGRSIAYTRSTSGGSEVVVYDFAEDRVRNLTNSAQRRFTNVGGGLRWSPDGNHLCFRAQFPGNTDEYGLFSLSTNGDTHVAHRSRRYLDFDVAWTASGSTLVFGGRTTQSDHESLQSVSMSTRTTDRPQILPGQYPNRSNRGVSRIPGGTELLYVSKPLNQ